MTATPSSVSVPVPHDGPGTHTLLVAIPVDDRLLADPGRHAEIVDAVVLEVVRTLGVQSRLRVLPPAVPCARCGKAEAMGGDQGRWCLTCFQIETGCGAGTWRARERTVA